MSLTRDEVATAAQECKRLISTLRVFEKAEAALKAAQEAETRVEALKAEAASYEQARDKVRAEAVSLASKQKENEEQEKESAAARRAAIDKDLAAKQAEHEASLAAAAEKAEAEVAEKQAAIKLLNEQENELVANIERLKTQKQHFTDQINDLKASLKKQL